MSLFRFKILYHITIFYFLFYKKVIRFFTIVSISDINGNVIAWSSSGSSGFKGSRKSTPFASQVASEFALKRAIDQGMKQLEINVSGTGSGRDSAIRAVQVFGLSITVIRDITSIPHNGCRPKKKRRV